MSVIASSPTYSSTLRSIAPPLENKKKDEEKDTPRQTFITSSKSANQQQSNNQATSPSVVVRQRPAVPPKPSLDIVRFSMAQARDDIDLDTILNELLELEEQLSGEAGDRLVIGLPTLPLMAQKPSELPKDLQSLERTPLPLLNNQQQSRRVQFQQCPSFHLPPQTSGLDFNDCNIPTDTDSAFGDSSSTESASHMPSGVNVLLPPKNDSNRTSEFSSADSFCGSLITPSPIRQIVLNEGCIRNQDCAIHYPTSSSVASQRPSSSTGSYNSSIITTKDENKKAQIREALEKMKEAKMKKVFVKIFLEDGTQRGILIDERWTVSELIRQLALKLNCAISPEHAIVEKYPKLLIKRVYEDHEFVVENLEEWGEDSLNELHFVRVPNRWSLFHSPQKFLLTNKNRLDFPSAERLAEWDSEMKRRLLNYYMGEETGGSACRVPELEGWLLLKVDGKKSWKRHFFVLRASGLYYVSKPGKARGPTRDLHCLMSVYVCTDWRKKYKAPNEWGFAIKHPRIQLKSSKFVKYICAEDEFTFIQWINALRIVKNGFSSLYKTFCSFHASNECVDSCSVRVEIPKVSMQNYSFGYSIGLGTPPNKPSHISASPCSTPGFVGSPVATRADISNPRPIRTSDSHFGSPSNQSGRIAFEQDFCNTIKRQSKLTNSVVSQQTKSNQKNYVLSSKDEYPSQPIDNISSKIEENDSDEVDDEIFPPPPSSLTSSPIHLNKTPPPLPPKRSVGTRLQSILITNDSPASIMKTPNQMDLMSELTKATNKQKVILENRISNANN
ncbi:hypothetical protein Mgra_00001729 [Meloidogyne graminicola]|uniref:Uncharacterized protein n=1 Tax=Meloidogyne graminicola TaxID=189291 RepID=A0A8T0A084_9BILA|nr:hypothetical protein Mgra_00001729 [Meloidogyne graminicola]